MVIEKVNANSNNFQSFTKKKLSLDKLIENAGYAVFEEIIAHFMPCTVAVLCGPGNNGADGFEVARLLTNVNWDVTAVIDKLNVENYQDVAKQKFDQYIGKIIDYQDIDLNNYALIVDAMFGSGINKNITGKYYNTIKKCNSLNLPVVSIDIPSGINPNTGQIMGAAIKSVINVTFTSKKPAHKIANLDEYFGKIVVRDIAEQ